MDKVEKKEERDFSGVTRPPSSSVWFCPELVVTADFGSPLITQFPKRAVVTPILPSGKRERSLKRAQELIN